MRVRTLTIAAGVTAATIALGAGLAVAADDDSQSVPSTTVGARDDGTDDGATVTVSDDTAGRVGCDGDGGGRRARGGGSPTDGTGTGTDGTTPETEAPSTPSVITETTTAVPDQLSP